MKSIVPAVALALTSQVVIAQSVDPASSTVGTLHDGLLSIMRAGSSAGQSGRSKMIAPVIDKTFDLAQMTRLSVGPKWSSISDKDQDGLVAAFRAMTIAQYAKNFDSYGGEKFTTSAKVEARGGDKLVRTTLVVPGGSNESLNYRLRKSGSQWKIIDVYYRNSISQLATRRSDFARVLDKGGASALISHLNRLAANPE